MTCLFQLQFIWVQSGLVGGDDFAPLLTWLSSPSLWSGPLYRDTPPCSLSSSSVSLPTTPLLHRSCPPCKKCEGGGVKGGWVWGSCLVAPSSLHATVNEWLCHTANNLHSSCLISDGPLPPPPFSLLLPPPPHNPCPFTFFRLLLPPYRFPTLPSSPLPSVSPQQQPWGRVGAGGQGFTEVLGKTGEKPAYSWI